MIFEQATFVKSGIVEIGGSMKYLTLLFLGVILAACGSSVPSGGGTTPTPSTVVRTVTLVSITAVKDCTLTTAGQFYWDFGANGISISSRSASQSVALYDGQTYPVGSSFSYVLGPTDILTISGAVYAGNTNISARTVGSFTQSFSSGQNFGQNKSGEVWVATLTYDAGCQAQVTYTIQ